jgi:ACS family D-galactonate transporter-like MFS transporter
MHGHRDIQPSLDASAGIAARPSRVRLLILALLTLGTLINYLDRTVISVAAPLMTKELGLDAVTLGIVFSAFSGHTRPHKFQAASSWTA